MPDRAAPAKWCIPIPAAASWNTAAICLSPGILSGALAELVERDPALPRRRAKQHPRMALDHLGELIRRQRLFRHRGRERRSLDQLGELICAGNVSSRRRGRRRGVSPPSASASGPPPNTKKQAAARHRTKAAPRNRRRIACIVDPFALRLSSTSHGCAISYHTVGRASAGGVSRYAADDRGTDPAGQGQRKPLPDADQAVVLAALRRMSLALPSRT